MDNSAQVPNPQQPVVPPAMPQQGGVPVKASLSETALHVAQTPSVAVVPIPPQQPAEMLTDAVQAAEAPVAIPAPIAPVSLPHREAGPGMGRMSEFIQPTNPEPVLGSEVKEAGVEVSPDMEQPQIPAVVAQAGVKPATAITPVLPAAESKVEYLTNAPFTQVEAQKIEKSKRASDSIRWLATFLLRQIKRIQLIGRDNGEHS